VTELICGHLTNHLAISPITSAAGNGIRFVDGIGYLLLSGVLLGLNGIGQATTPIGRLHTSMIDITIHTTNTTTANQTVRPG